MAVSSTCSRPFTWALCFFAITSTASPLSHRQYSNNTIVWQNYPTLNISGLEYGNITVPLDWDDPNGETITIGLNRLRANDSNNRIGTVIYNPGGPGGVATDDILVAAQAELAGIQFYTSVIRSHFDIVGLDPRGVGTSTPIQCNASLWNERVSISPKDQESFDELVAYNIALGESCLNLTGPLLGHVDTTSVVKDVEAVRVALNDGKLNFLGQSYGSQIATQYAELYPQNVGALALDGNLDHSGSETSTLFTETWAYEDELLRFASWCANTTDCALYGQDILGLFDNLTAQAEHTPIPAPGCVDSEGCRADVTAEELRQNVQGALLYKEPIEALGISGWSGLAVALSEALQGNATSLSTELAQDDTSSLFPSLAIGCLDWLHESKTFADLEYKQQLGRAVAPHTRGATQSYVYQTSCIGWPVPIQNPQHFAHVNGTPPVLLVNSNHDPSTSYVWAHSVLAQIPSGVLLTRDGDGHTSYLLGGEATQAIDEYFVNGTLPEPASMVSS